MRVSRLGSGGARVLALALALAACTPRRAEPLAAVPPAPPAPTPPTAVPPPSPPPVDLAPPALQIDLAALEPDPSPELRWPLGAMDHPELVPHYAIARELAEPGVDWLDLCKRGVYRRTIPRLRDQHAYLRAWCAVIANDHATALGVLASLRGSLVPGLAAAVRADLPNVLATGPGVDDARELLHRHGLQADEDVLDRLAATYVEVGSTAAANEINELALISGSTNAAKHCQRLARRVLLAPDAVRSSPAFARGADAADATLFGAHLQSDATCRELDAQLSCWLVKDRCARWYALRGVSEHAVAVALAHEEWPRGAARASPAAWHHVVMTALGARPAAEAYRYIVLGLESQAATTPCRHGNGMTTIEDLLLELDLDPRVPADLAARLQTLRAQLPGRCWNPPR